MAKTNLNVRVEPETRRLADLAASFADSESTSAWVRRVIHEAAIRQLSDPERGERVELERREAVPA